jgi:dephospho-CoA kinase
MAIFGKGIYVDGKLDRAKLASIVFTDRKKLERLHSIVHPVVAKAFNDFAMKNSASPYVLKEAAIIFEHGLEKQLDAVITVVAPDEVRIQRVMERDGISREDVQKRIDNQLSQEEKAKRSDFVIVNDGKQLIVPQVLAIHQQLSR